nr:uncharacterized protein LOC107394988 isoform X7 [Nothobranchius furzeri]XP_054605576.1 uncharacterized protein LOC107394988 isoform X7 [Nothobranchius furzeri]
MFTLLTSMSWPPGGIHKSTCCVACRRVAAFIDSGFWKEKTGRDLEFFPQQFMGNCCGTFMLMYALCICTSSPPSFTEEEMPAIRLWWCIQLMERFGIEGYGRHFRQTGTIIFAALVQARHQAWTKICLLDRRSIPSPPGNSPACLQGTKGNLLQV